MKQHSSREQPGVTGNSFAPLATPADAEEGIYVGFDVGAETIKVVELSRAGNGFSIIRRTIAEHGKDVAGAVVRLAREIDWPHVRGAAVTGRLGRQLQLRSIPLKQAQIAGARQLFGREPLTVVSIGSHGFSILELRAGGTETLRENSRCSQGTGNFLRQLVGRFGLSIEQASELCTPVERPAVLSGRCPVILKTDMTHLANKGEDRASILAGLFDAVCENVFVLIKPETCPKRVVLIGGVARSARIRNTFRARLQACGLELLDLDAESACCVEALGAAALATATPAPIPDVAHLLRTPERTEFEVLPALRTAHSRIRRMPAPALACAPSEPVFLGLDIGSTGSKAGALNAARRVPVWESYRPTAGDPVGAAQALLREFTQSAMTRGAILGFGATGSGREIVGSLLTACYGKERVYVLNEIAAHAEGAHHYDRRVDTIFEIGGQDAKYIRVADGRVIDCAMNEACSAGTGSFIEEQGRKFPGIAGVTDLARHAMSADSGLSLGQHCSVFMAEVIDEAVAAGMPTPAIIAGLYDSVIQNYLNRVKGSRPVGQVIFCQGMPFASDALAAAVARQTGSEVIVPPSPGTVGALGIALLAARVLQSNDSIMATPVVCHRDQAAGVADPSRFLDARVVGKDTFQCRATVGCGGEGNLCRIERLRTVVAGKALTFTWGGGCALHDKATRRKKLPDRAPDPFREREELVRRLLAPRFDRRGGKRVAITDEFALKGLFPFFVTFISELGCEVVATGAGDQRDLKRGIISANVSFCAPMQLYHGLVSRLAGSGAEALLLPRVLSLPRVGRETHAVACPIVQASPDVLAWDLPLLKQLEVLSPIIAIGAGGLGSSDFLRSCRELATSLGAADGTWRRAHAIASAAQADFEQRAYTLGAQALEFGRDRGIVPVVVMGRPYTIYNTVLNSNVPAILREQGAIGIPLDCYPVDAATPVFDDMYWSYGQRILRAAHQVRRRAGEYAIYCSNYACGPDSFNLHFFAHIMAGKPFAIIETDGHSGDAGTKTRVEAFLHCVEQDRATQAASRTANDFTRLHVNTVRLRDVIVRRERLLVPWMTDASMAVAAALRGQGVEAESLPPPGRDELRTGRRHTSGKECLPIALTLGALLNRLAAAEDDDSFVYLMASTYGPCRFGVYNLLNQIVLKQQGWSQRVRVWSPRDTGYFDEFPPAFGMVTFAGLIAIDLLTELVTLARCDEAKGGAADAVYASCRSELLALIESRAAENLSTPAALWQVSTGEIFGVRRALAAAAQRFNAIRVERAAPLVLLVGEIYVRSVPFANDHIADKLRARGLRVRPAPVQEWLEYCDAMAARAQSGRNWSAALSRSVQARIRRTLSRAIDDAVGWAPRHSTAEILGAAQPYLRDSLEGEAVLTLGGPACAWRHGHVDGVVSAGPHECMPNKLAESQLFHVGQREGLPSLTIPVNGDPVDPAALDNFAFEVQTRWHRQQTAATP